MKNLIIAIALLLSITFNIFLYSRNIDLNENRENLEASITKYVNVDRK